VLVDGSLGNKKNLCNRHLRFPTRRPGQDLDLAGREGGDVSWRLGGLDDLPNTVVPCDPK
jgi:hypothetical protein